MSKFKFPKNFIPGETFRVQLSADQMNFLSAIIPAGYSLHLEPRKNIPKHALPSIKKKNNDISISNMEESVSVQTQKKQAMNKNIKKPALTPSVSVNEKPTTNKNVSGSKWMDQLPEPIKKCAKIFNMLKNHKSSWPFLEPVNAQALGIPEYYEIIKEPMDLSKIQSKLKSQKYTDFSQFQADVLKIIENSYRFNETNQQFLRLTSQFQNFFNKTIIDPQESNKSSKNTNKKKKKSSAANRQSNELAPVTLMEKKQLAQQIRRLGKQHLKGVISIVFDQSQSQNDVIDLEKLNQKKLRQLQKFVRNRIIQMQERVRNNQNQKNQVTNLDLFESDQSSFPTENEKKHGKSQQIYKREQIKGFQDRQLSEEKPVQFE